MQEQKKQIKNFFGGLVFEPNTHTYHTSKKKLKSVSSIIHNFIEPFDADKIAGFVARSRGISKDEVLMEWAEKRDTACAKGARVHNFGETYKKGLIPSDGFEEAVVNFWDSLPNHIQPFFNELKMFSNELGLAGTADIILYNTITKKFIIADYKTNIDLFKNYKGKTLLTPFKHLLDSPYNKYQIQLSLYQILFELAGDAFRVEKRKIIWLRENGTFYLYDTIDYREPLLKILKA